MMLWLGIACGVDVEPVVVAAASPLLAIDRDIDRTPWTGTIRERLEAHGYTYWQVDDRWVVGLDKPLYAADVVVVSPIGEAREFESARTGRTFDVLQFAVLRSQAEDVTEPRRGAGE